MRSISTVHGVITYLTKYSPAWYSGEGLKVQICDGPPRPPMDAEPNIVCYGFTGTPGEPVVENTRTVEGIKVEPNRESYNLTCIASVWIGNQTDMAVTRGLCYDLVNILNKRLAENPTMDGLVMRARIGSDSLAQDQTTMGAVATVRFNVQVEAFTRG